MPLSCFLRDEPARAPPVSGLGCPTRLPASDPESPGVLAAVYHTLPRKFRCFVLVWFALLVCFLATRRAGSQFPEQGLNPRPLQGKLRDLTPGPPGKSLNFRLKGPWLPADLNSLARLHLPGPGRPLFSKAPCSRLPAIGKRGPCFLFTPIMPLGPDFRLVGRRSPF